MLPSLVAAAPARILTSGQLGQPSGASPPSPRLTSNARGARGRPRDRPRARLTRERERLRRGVESRRAERRGAVRGRRSARSRPSPWRRAPGTRARVAVVSRDLTPARAPRRRLASRGAKECARVSPRRRLARPPSRRPRARRLLAPPRAPAPAPRRPPPPPRRRRDADAPTPAGASSSSSSSSSSSPPGSSPSRASAADAFRPELAAELRRLGLELGECLDEGSHAAVFEATRLDASTEEEERRAEKVHAASATAAFDAASAASASDNAPSSSARSSAGVDAWAAAEGSTRFAVKILSSSKAKSPDAVRDFKREAHRRARTTPASSACTTSRRCPNPETRSWSPSCAREETCGTPSRASAPRAEHARARAPTRRARRPSPSPSPPASVTCCPIDLLLERRRRARRARRASGSDAAPEPSRARARPRRGAGVFARVGLRAPRRQVQQRPLEVLRVLPSRAREAVRLRERRARGDDAAAPARRRASGPLAWLGGGARSSSSWRPVGSMLWMAPEMLAPPAEDEAPPEGSSGDAADVYALGVVVWEMMTRRVPWVLGDVSRAEVVDAVVRRGERLPMPEGIDPKLAAALESAWAPRPADRPSAAAIADALRAAGAEGWGEEARSPPPRPSPTPEGARWSPPLGEEARAEDEERGGPSRRRTPRATRSPRARARLKRARARPTPRPPRRKKRLLLRRERAWDLPTGRRRATSNGATERRPRTTTRSKPPPRGAPRPPRVASRRRARIPRVGSAPRARAPTRRRSPRTSPRRLPARLRLRASDAAARKKALAAKRSECEALERKAEELKLRSKTDPFAAFTADAKAREARRRRREVELETAESEANDWRATREVLEKALRRAEKEHGEARRRYRDASRGKGA